MALNEWIDNILTDWADQIDEDVESPPELVLADWLCQKLSENGICLTKEMWKEYRSTLGDEED